MNRRVALGLSSILILGVALLSLFFTQNATAESFNSNAAQGIEISPALVELNGAKGNTYSINLKVTNVTLTDLFYTSSIEDFSAKDETGTPQILLDSQLPASASIKTWVKSPSSFTLKSRESRTITVLVTIPQGAEPGGHYGVVRFSGRPPELESTGVALSASAGTLLLIRVDGKINESATVKEFYSAQNNKQSFFFETSPVSFVARIKNDGNIHIKPIGTIEVKDMFGNVSSTIALNDSKSNVLPDSIRRFDSQTDNKWMFGRYTADLVVGYGTTGQALTSTISFWVIPYRLILTILFISATVIYVLSRVIKVYNKRIIAKALKAQNENTTKTKKTTKKKDKK